MNQTPVAPPPAAPHVPRRAGAAAATGLLRRAGPADADRIRAFVCGLSPRSQYFRFFASVAPPSTGLLRALTGSAGPADVLIITAESGEVIAHGMAADVSRPSGEAASIGLVVADRWQHHGLGTLLLSTLVGRAAGRGITSLELDVLPANDRMRGIITRRWPDAPIERTRDAIIYRPVIAPPSAGLPVPSLIGLRAAASPAGADQGGQHVISRSAA
jgi:GNAT superfamily N-acetyltransferase